MNTLTMDQIGLVPLTDSELENTEGGIVPFIIVAAIAIGLMGGCTASCTSTTTTTTTSADGASKTQTDTTEVTVGTAK